MAVPYKIVIDCADPHRLAEFWSEALGYVVEDNSSLVQALLDAGQVPEAAVTRVRGVLAFVEAQGIRDPDDPFDEYTGVGRGGRVLFQRVPEAKTVKNRVHLDLHVGADARAETVDRLKGLGATVLWEGSQGPNSWVTMADPESNEFCVA
jgi:Glyoxalase-like domain